MDSLSWSKFIGQMRPWIEDTVASIGKECVFCPCGVIVVRGFFCRCGAKGCHYNCDNDILSKCRNCEKALSVSSSSSGDRTEAGGEAWGTADCDDDSLGPADHPPAAARPDHHQAGHGDQPHQAGGALRPRQSHQGQTGLQAGLVFLDFSLSISANRSEKFQDCLKSYLSPSEIEKICDCCSVDKSTQHKKSQRVLQRPQLFIAHLKSYTILLESSATMAHPLIPDTTWPTA